MAPRLDSGLIYSLDLLLSFLNPKTRFLILSILDYFLIYICEEVPSQSCFSRARKTMSTSSI